jgi:hypothetical protein
MINAVLVVVVKDTAKGRFRAFAARDVELFGGQLPAPVRVRFHNLGHFDGLGQFTVGSDDADLHGSTGQWARRHAGGSEHFHEE